MFVPSVYFKPISFGYTTYGAYGISGFIMAIYFCEWKQVGQYIPLWNKRYSTE
ncbi:unnamed protein product [Haemonchus placei]|uniref:Amino acid permease n=1 Tax=Haemonchus placei TaxID=6290 RepID=A0A0N4WU56_HAEPC|nr:unnamed protein product [Haemonchus placei]